MCLLHIHAWSKQLPQKKQDGRSRGIAPYFNNMKNMLKTMSTQYFYYCYYSILYNENFPRLGKHWYDCFTAEYRIYGLFVHYSVAQLLKPFGCNQWYIIFLLLHCVQMYSKQKHITYSDPVSANCSPRKILQISEQTSHNCRSFWHCGFSF